MYTKMELEFARQYLDLVPQEMFLKPLAPLFEHGLQQVDWQQAEEQLKEVLSNFFTSTDFANYAGPEDINIFVTAKDPASGALLGLIQFLVTSDYNYGTVKVALYGVAANAHDSGIELMLMSSIFKLIPEVSRIFLHTRKTNQSALDLYRAWGFKQFAGPLANWTDMEYLAEHSDMLQKTAQLLQ
jgi:ribosomal protein S18 acetylase RimI-like enzyme